MSDLSYASGNIKEPDLLPCFLKEFNALVIATIRPAGIERALRTKG